MIQSPIVAAVLYNTALTSSLTFCQYNALYPYIAHTNFQSYICSTSIINVNEFCFCIVLAIFVHSVIDKCANYRNYLIVYWFCVLFCSSCKPQTFTKYTFNPSITVFESYYIYIVGNDDTTHIEYCLMMLHTLFIIKFIMHIVIWVYVMDIWYRCW